MSISNSYTLLARFLSPCHNPATADRHLRAIRSGEIDWPALLHQANLQLVTPLWYLNLCRDSLIEEIPQDLSAYLAELYAANRDRNIVFARVLAEVLEVCQREKVLPVLLKGAATFSDSLYGDAGARIQADLDLLLPADEAQALSCRLQEQGYQILEFDEIADDPTLPTIHHHHLKVLRKPATPVVIEIHYRVTRGRAENVFKDASTVPATVAGIACRMLAPEWRDLHNILHAMVSDRGTLHSLIPLKAVAESAWLQMRYPQACFQHLAAMAKACGCSHDYHLYRAVSQRLGLWPALHEDSTNLSAFRINRCLEHGGYLTRQQIPLQLSLYLALYRKLHAPRWAWDYLCYLDSNRSTLERLQKMAGYLARPAKWKKV